MTHTGSDRYCPLVACGLFLAAMLSVLAGTSPATAQKICKSGVCAEIQSFSDVNRPLIRARVLFTTTLDPYATHYNARIEGGSQIEIDNSGMKVALIELTRDQRNFSAQACYRYCVGCTSRCTPWANFSRTAAPPPPPPPPASSGPKQVEPNIDRPGSDYRNFDLATASSDQCRAACSSDGQCLAYTYVRPGIQGPKARCWLKNSIPATRVSDCCVSGVIRTAAAPQAPKPTPAPTSPATPTPTNSANCKPGFVWRVARPSDLVCVTPESRARVAQENATAKSRVQPGGGAYGPNTCLTGFVWREAFPGDLVCVTPEVRTLVREENRVGPTRRAQP